MQTFDAKQTSDQYTDALTIADLWGSSGGYFIVTVADVYMQLEFGELGQTWWTNEFHVAVGNGEIDPGTLGVRFRSYTSGKPATVTATLFGEAEPRIIIGSPSTANVTNQINFQHNDVLVAAEQTLDFEDATGFAWTVVDDAANTRVKVTPPQPARVLLAATTLAAPAATVTFSAISGAYQDLELRFSAQSNLNANTDTVTLQFNGDTGNNYDYERISGIGNAAAAVSATTQPNITIGEVNGEPGTIAGGDFAGAIVEILNYAQSGQYKPVFARVGTVATTINATVKVTTGKWYNSSGAITSIVVACGGQFVAASNFRLYGLL